MLGRKALLFCIIYLLSAIGYCLYSIGTSTGLGGYLAYLQLRYFNSAYDVVTIPIMMVLLIAPGFAILALALKISPSLFASSTENPPNLEPIEIPEPKQIPIQWAAAVVIGIGAIISAVLLVNQTRDKNEKIYDIVLNEHPAVPPKGAKFVQVTGVPSPRFRSVYKETDRVHHVWTYIYVAVTQEGWNTNDPVRYFALFEPTEGRRSLPPAFEARDAAEFAGRIGETLPISIRRKFESEGLKIEPSHFVINYGDLPNTQDFPFWLPVAIAAGLIAAMAIVVAILWCVNFMMGGKPNAPA
jgi:hypothetical protein